MKIGDVAKQLGMPSSTIRYYERRGLIPPPSRVSGRREFNDGVLATLRFIQLCQTAGFTINEIGELLEKFVHGASEAGVCNTAVSAKRNAVRKQIAELEQVDAMLGEMTKCRCKSIQQCVDHAIN